MSTIEKKSCWHIIKSADFNQKNVWCVRVIWMARQTQWWYQKRQPEKINKHNNNKHKTKRKEKKPLKIMDAYRTLKGITIDSPDINTIYFYIGYGFFHINSIRTTIPHVKMCCRALQRVHAFSEPLRFLPFLCTQQQPSCIVLLFLFGFYRFMGRLRCVACLRLHQLFEF